MITFQDDLTENKWNMIQTIFTLPKDGVRKKVRNSRRAGELGVLPQQERPLYHHTRAKWYSWKHVYVSMQKLVVATKPSKTIIKNNLRDLRYYSHLFSQHCFNNKKQCTSRKKTKNAQPRLEPAPFERPIVVWCSNHWATKATECKGSNSTI